MDDEVVGTDERAADKALMTAQLMKYAQDLASVYEDLKAQTRTLKGAYQRLEEEIEEHRKKQEKLIESEKRYRSLFEGSRDAILVFSPKGRLLETNPAGLELFGYTKGEMQKVKPGYLFSDERVFRAFRADLLETGSIEHLEVEMRKKDGTTIDCVVTAEANRADDGKVIDYRGTVRDISQQKRAAAIMEHGRKLEILSSAVSAVAHEVRNPLAVASSSAQILMGSDVPEELRDVWIRKIISGINMASMAIDNLLRFASPSSTVSVTRLDLASLIREVAELMIFDSASRNVRIVPSTSKEKVMIDGDQRLLSQALKNLLVSCVKVTPPGGVLRVVAETAGGAPAIVIHCPGDLSFLANSDGVQYLSDPDRFGGKRHELGFSVSCSILEQHSGSITIRYDPESGSTLVAGFRG